MPNTFPACRQCEKGVLNGRDGAAITYKAWVCSNPSCGFHLRIDNGEISRGSKVNETAK